jgi:hypothetical protein
MALLRENADWIHLAQYWFQCRHLAYSGIQLWISYKTESLDEQRNNQIPKKDSDS